MTGRAAIENAEEAPDPKPIIELNPDAIHEVATQAEDALIASGLPIYQRGEHLVKPIALPVDGADERQTIAPGLKQLKTASLRDHLAQAADWRKWDSRTKKYAPCSPPTEIAEIVLSRFGEWEIPTITGVIQTPTVRPDGSLLLREGYDRKTHLYHVLDPSLRMPPIPKHPTKTEASQALDLIDALLVNFPFKGDVDRSVALSAILSAVGRGSFTALPLHAFSAVEAGSGKSFLADVVAAFVTANYCPVVAPGNNEEMDKKIAGLLLAGLPIISIDNVVDGLGTPTLNQAVERPLIRIRPLGASDTVLVETRCVFLATGNNLKIVGDMARRTLRAEMDAKMERPETRRFDFNPFKRVVRNRGAYVAAALTVLRAYQVADDARLDLEPLQSYGHWSAMIRAPLVWLGYADPTKSVEALRDDDPERGAIKAVLAGWHAAFGDEAVTVAMVVDAIKPENDTREIVELREALRAIAPSRGSGINNTQLGTWLGKNKDRQLDGFRLSSPKGAATRSGTKRWRVVRLDGQASKRTAPLTDAEYLERRAAMAAKREARRRAG